MQRAAVRVCVREGPSRALLFTRLPRSLPSSLSLSVPSSPLPIHSVCRDNELGDAAEAQLQAAKGPKLTNLYL